MIQNGRWSKARQILSPNHNERPPGAVPTLLVIHNISLPPGEFGGGFVENFFLNRLDRHAHPYFETIADLCVSSHCFIDRLGQVTQFVPFDLRAWHAGRSCFNGEKECNDFSIGIELEGADTIPYAEAQYFALVELTEALMHAYPGISTDRIAGHSDIAPGRKTDPGPAFDWHRYLDELKTKAQ